MERRKIMRRRKGKRIEEYEENEAKGEKQKKEDKE